MKNKKTILYIGGFEFPDKNAAAQRVLANAKIFRELGYDVNFIGVDKKLSTDIELRDTKFNVQGFQAWSVPYPRSKKDWLYQIVSISHIESFVEEACEDDLYAIVAYNYPAIALHQIRKFCSNHNILFIADPTEWYENSGGGLLFNTVKWLDTTLRMRIVHPYADGIISASKYLANFYKKNNFPIVVLPTLYDVRDFKHADSSLKIQTDIVKIMYAGSAFNLARVDKNRTNIKDRLDKIVLMLDRVYLEKTNFILNIYGLELENYLSVFPEHQSILKKLSKNIIFHGRKPHLEIVKNIQQSDFTIFLRNIDRVIEAGFPSKFSESISYGTPVISNMISNIEDYAIEGKNSYIISLDNKKKQVKKMVDILNQSREQRNAMKNYCLKHKIFDYRNYFDEVQHFLEKVEKNVQI